jgi:hypothetical protein
MGTLRKFASIGIRKIAGGRDPLNVTKDFILSLEADPNKSCQQKSSENMRWLVELSEEDELEIILDGINTPAQSTIYLGINAYTVPIRNALEVLALALSIADGLVGIKLSLVNNFLVLSSCSSANDLSLEDLKFYYDLLISQRNWFIETLEAELKA